MAVKLRDVQFFDWFWIDLRLGILLNIYFRQTESAIFAPIKMYAFPRATFASHNNSLMSMNELLIATISQAA